MAASGSTPIVITVGDGKGGKQRLNIFMDPSKIRAVRQFAQLNGVTQGEIIEKAVEIMFQAMVELEKEAVSSQPDQDFFERLMNSPKWRVAKK